MADLRNQLFIVLIAFFCVGTISAQLPSYLPANGLVAWYPFNGNANDESGNGNNGTAFGAVLTTDRFGNNNSCYNFNGMNSSISTLSGGPLNQSPRSFSLWLRTNKTGENYLIQYGNPTGAGDYFGIAMNNYCSGIGIDISNGVAMWGPNSLTNNNWHHCVIVFDPTVGSTLVDLIVYVDGVLQSSLNCSLSLNNNTQINTQEFYPFLIGGGATTPGSRHFQGDIDDIGIYNRALTQAEVTALYTSTTSSTSGNTNSTSPAPPGIPYQAEVRNENGEALANANVNIRFTLHELAANGTVSYQETHALTTNDLGLFAATIGAGAAVQGTFASINWAQTTKFLQVEVDAGNGYITMGNQQLMSVPYALYAANGPAGPAGPAGPQGQPGPQGLQGPQGPAGVNSMPAGGLNGQVITICNGELTWTYGGICPGPFHGILRDTCDAIGVLNPNINYNMLVDQDGYTYKTVVIGNQEWMAENLRSTIFSNGSDIVDWVYCNGDSTLDCPYGKLYSAFSIYDSRNVCPSGWHVPSVSDWNELITFLDPNAYDPQTYGFPGLLNSSTAGAALNSIGPNYNTDPTSGSTNSSGFSALPTGIFDGLTYQAFPNASYWWSSSRIRGMSLSYFVNPSFTSIAPDLNSDGFYFAVRCIKNN
jgi:uncharacterized protein (TIGR02145 family)